MLILIFIHKWIWRIFIKQTNAYTIDREISLNSVDFYFSICLPLIFLSLLIAPVSRQQLFEHNIEKERAMTSLDCFSFPPFRMMLIVSFSHVVFIVLRNVPSWPAVHRTVIMKAYWILAKALSASFEMIMWFLSLYLFTWLISLIDLCILNHLCISVITHILVMVDHVLELCLFSVCKLP